MMKAPKRLKNEALKEWKRVTAFIDLADSDVEALAIYCESFQRYIKLSAQLATEAPTIPIGVNGAKQINPLVSMVRDEQNLLLKYQRRFGLDPESRGQKRKTNTQVEDDDGMADLLRGG